MYESFLQKKKDFEIFLAKVFKALGRRRRHTPYLLPTNALQKDRIPLPKDRKEQKYRTFVPIEQARPEGN